MGNVDRRGAELDFLIGMSLIIKVTEVLYTTGLEVRDAFFFNSCDTRRMFWPMLPHIFNF